jgi:hypothetical protein
MNRQIAPWYLCAFTVGECISKGIVGGASDPHVLSQTSEESGFIFSFVRGSRKRRANYSDIRKARLQVPRQGAWGLDTRPAKIPQLDPAAKVAAPKEF